MDLAELLDPQAVDLHTAASCRVEVFRRLGELAALGEGPKSTEITAALHARERLGSTIVAPGMALPHARLKGLERPRLAAVVLREGASFDGDPVRLAMAVLVPEEETTGDLLILRRLAAVLRRPEGLKRLVSVSDAASFIDALKVESDAEH